MIVFEELCNILKSYGLSLDGVEFEEESDTCAVSFTEVHADFEYAIFITEDLVLNRTEVLVCKETKFNTDAEMLAILKGINNINLYNSYFNAYLMDEEPVTVIARYHDEFVDLDSLCSFVRETISLAYGVFKGLEE